MDAPFNARINFNITFLVFNDGDEKVLRRTQMCLKGAKHFDTESNLDQMPLYNPEQFCAAPKPPPKAKKIKK